MAAVAGTRLVCSSQTLEEQLEVLRSLHLREQETNQAFYELHPELDEAKQKRVKGKEAKAQLEIKEAQKQEEKAAAQKDKEEDGSARPQISLLERLQQFDLQPREDVEAKKQLEARRPQGHSTHNLLVKDKKSKRLVLVSHRQSAKADLKQVAKATGNKELRLAGAKDVQAAVGEAAGGCLSVLSLWASPDPSSLVVVLDEQLQNADDDTRLCICVGKPAGCNDAADHSQHKVVDIRVADFKALLKQVGCEVVLMQFPEQ